MKNAVRWFSLAAFAALPLSVPAAEAGGEITADRVNLRARPSPQVEVVGQLNQGDRVVVRQVTNEWVEVVPPEAVDFYVHKEFVRDGRAQVSPLTVRSGPGINFSKVGSLKKGDAVVVRGEFADWVKIAPPPGSSLWISRTYVKLGPGVTVAGAAPAAAKPATPPPATPAGPAAPPAAPPVVAVAPPPRPVPIPAVVPAAPQPIRAAQPGAYTPDDLRLAPVENQGQIVQREGVVKATVFVFNRPSRFQLTSAGGHATETICYLRGNEEQLNSFLEQRLRVRGRQYWVQGSRHPVVVVDQIALPPK